MGRFLVRRYRNKRGIFAGFAALVVVIVVGLLVFSDPSQRLRVGKSYPATFSCKGIGANISNVAGGDWGVVEESGNDILPGWQSSGSEQGALKVTGTTSRTHSSFDMSPKPKVALVGIFTAKTGGSVKVSEDFADEQIPCGAAN